MNFAVEVSFMINFVMIKTFDKDSCLLLISHFNITGGRTLFSIQEKLLAGDLLSEENLDCLLQ